MKDKFIVWLRTGLRKFLGIEAINTNLGSMHVRQDRTALRVSDLEKMLGKNSVVAIDYQFNSPTVIIVAARIQGISERVHVIDQVEIKSASELRDLVEFLKYRYSYERDQIFIDMPPGIANIYDRVLRVPRRFRK